MSITVPNTHKIYTRCLWEWERKRWEEMKYQLNQ